MKCKKPFQLKGSDASGYPAYEAITVDGITEIIEHRKMEPVFYVTDDASVWAQYTLKGC